MQQETSDWEDTSAAALFMRRLVRERAVEFMRSKEYLKPLRFDYDRAKADQKLFGHIWAEYGTNVFQLIAEAHGEKWDTGGSKWDAEDEEKHCRKKEVAVNQRKDDDLVAAREAGPRERQHQLQGKFETRVRLVEEDQEQGRSAARKAPEARKEEGRGEGFYRRAGGCG